MTVVDESVQTQNLALERRIWAKKLSSRGQIRVAQVIELALLSIVLLWPVPTAGNVLLLLCAAIALQWTAATRRRLSLSVLDDLPTLMISLAAAQGLTYWVLALVDAAPTRSELVASAASLIAAVVLGRLIAYTLIRSLRRSGTLSEEVVVIGRGVYADFLLDRIQAHREYGLKLSGHLSLADEALRDPRRLVSAIRVRPNVRTVVIAQARLSDTDVVLAVRTLVANGFDVYYVPRFPEFVSGREASDSIWGLPLVAVRPPGGGLQRMAKRGFDLVVSFIALLVLAPLMLVIGLAIKRETGGAILFRQVRVGQGASTFELLKFQTMVPEDDLESRTQWTIASDARLGRLGRFLRASSLDELPQLVNVLRGDMSLVGPRPERPHYVAEFSDQFVHYADRHRVPVGLTGWAQIHRLRGDTSIDDRARFDNAYCDHWRLWNDAKIILKTIPEVIRHSGS